VKESQIPGIPERKNVPAIMQLYGTCCFFYYRRKESGLFRQKENISVAYLQFHHTAGVKIKMVKAHKM
jgi:hypothetical protein